jgi:hypothetical protein
MTDQHNVQGNLVYGADRIADLCERDVILDIEEAETPYVGSLSGLFGSGHRN